MDTTTTNNFTKEIFYILHMDWTEKAKARDLLSQILVEEETLGSVLEDVVFSMTEFMNVIREEHGMFDTPECDKVVAYIVLRENCYYISVGNDIDSKIAFMIEAGDGDYYRIEKPCPNDCIQEINLENMEELKEAILFWFNDFYKHIDETMR